MSQDLSIRLFGKAFKTPIMVASGTFGGIYDKVVDLNQLGAVVLKSVTVNPRKGNPPPRIVETASGTINSIGLENPGIESFLSDEIHRYLAFDTFIIISIAGKSPEEFAFLAKKIQDSDIDKSKIAAIELNLSCPNVAGGLDFSTKSDLAFSTTKSVKEVTKIPVISKLSPNVTDIVVLAKACVDAGADAISLINTVKAMAVDWKTGKSLIGSQVGGLSGPAIKPIALRFVYEVRQALPAVPIIGIGGIMNAHDVLEFFSVGANAVQIGTANFVEADITVRITDDLRRLWRR
ncbi:MAG: dihydroorotate dehydrogenase [Planctomycetes bacterium]|nr:dihydroorotate dehydrogenase [Planctomycetota bacterium]